MDAEEGESSSSTLQGMRGLGSTLRHLHPSGDRGQQGGTLEGRDGRSLHVYLKALGNKVRSLKLA